MWKRIYQGDLYTAQSHVHWPSPIIWPGYFSQSRNVLSNIRSPGISTNHSMFYQMLGCLRSDEVPEFLWAFFRPSEWRRNGNSRQKKLSMLSWIAQRSTWVTLIISIVTLSQKVTLALLKGAQSGISILNFVLHGTSESYRCCYLIIISYNLIQLNNTMQMTTL